MRLLLSLTAILIGSTLLLISLTLGQSRPENRPVYWMFDITPAGLFARTPDASYQRPLIRTQFPARLDTALTMLAPDGRHLLNVMLDESSQTHLLHTTLAPRQTRTPLSDFMAGSFDLGHLPSPDGRYLLLRHTTTSGQHIQRIDTQTATLQTLAVFDLNTLMRSIFWSADGNHIYLSVEALPAGAITYRLPATGGELETVYEGPITEPVWSPDGEWLLASSGPPEQNLLRMRADGTRQMTIAQTGQRLRPEDWLAGDWILFTSGQGSGRDTVYRVRPDGSELAPLLNTGQRFFYEGQIGETDWVVLRSRFESRQTLHRVAVATLDRQYLASIIFDSPVEIDGERVFFTATQTGQTGIYMLAGVERAPRRLMSLPSVAARPAYTPTPDGEHLLISYRPASGQPEGRRYRLNVNDGGLIELPPARRTIFSPTIDRGGPGLAPWVLGLGLLLAPAAVAIGRHWAGRAG
jgi:hypothetical protein